MKPLPIVLALVCAALVAALFVTKQGDNAQHETDVATLTECSNTLAAAQVEISSTHIALTTLSNRLDAAQSATVAVSNQLAEAQSNVALGAEQVSALTKKITALKAENQTFAQNAVELTNQMATLTESWRQQIAIAQTNALRVSQDHVQLENRLRRDVAERIMVERKFNSPTELKNQLAKVMANPTNEITAEKIYAGLDVEVKSDGSIHVLSPN